jgi:hypothetical protein
VVLLAQDYEYTPLYYADPTQVRFYDANDGIWRGGIAYNDFVICGCCGSKLWIEDIISDAKKIGIHFDDAIIEMEWIDISNEIIGE